MRTCLHGCLRSICRNIGGLLLAVSALLRRGFGASGKTRTCNLLIRRNLGWWMVWAFSAKPGVGYLTYPLFGTPRCLKVVCGGQVLAMSPSDPDWDPDAMTPAQEEAMHEFAEIRDSLIEKGWSWEAAVDRAADISNEIGSWFMGLFDDEGEAE